MYSSLSATSAWRISLPPSTYPSNIPSPSASVGPPRPADDASEEAWREYMGHYYTQEETTYCGVPVLTRPPPGDWCVFNDDSQFLICDGK